MVNKLTNTVKPLDEVDKINEIIDALDDKQDTLVSGTNIKTINNNSILGSGNLALDGLPSQTGNANKFLTTDGTDASWAAVPTRNIGEIVASITPLTDAGLHLLDGALINGSGIYADFVTYIAGIYDASASYFCTEAQWQTSVTTYGVCGKFVYDSTNNTVRLPKITGIIEGTTDVTALGDLVQAGLPNIEGTVYGTDFLEGPVVTGAFYNAGTVSSEAPAGGSGTSIKLGFEASRSNSIYGNSNTVQPQTIKAFYYIVIATSTKTDIEVDIDEVVTDLNGKADIDLTNVPASKAILQESYVNGTSWYRVYSDDWCEQGGIIAQDSGNAYLSPTITFMKPFLNTNYNIQMTNGGGNTSYTPLIQTKTVSSCSFSHVQNTSGNRANWYACGYIN